jgi:hypothetical protein
MCHRCGADAPHAFLRAAASWQEPFASVERLTREGASINAMDRSGQTALHLAVAEGLKHRNLDAARILLQAGADREVRDNEGRTAQDIAVNYLTKKCQNGHFQSAMKKLSFRMMEKIAYGDEAVLQRDEIDNITRGSFDDPQLVPSFSVRNLSLLEASICEEMKELRWQIKDCFRN